MRVRRITTVDVKRPSAVCERFCGHGRPRLEVGEREKVRGPDVASDLAAGFLRSSRSFCKQARKTKNHYFIAVCKITTHSQDSQGI